MTSQAATVDEYLAELPEDRRAALQALREVFLKNLPEGLEEGMQYGMIGYFVPHSRYPKGYHCNPKEPLPFAHLASQKNNLAMYLFCIYGSAGESEAFQAAWKATGKRLDMGKSCVRFRRIEDVPLEVVAQTLQSVSLDAFLAQYDATRPKGK